MKMRLERFADHDKRKIKNHQKQKRPLYKWNSGLSIKAYFIRLQTASA